MSYRPISASNIVTGELGRPLATGRVSLNPRSRKALWLSSKRGVGVGHHHRARRAPWPGQVPRHRHRPRFWPSVHVHSMCTPRRNRAARPGTEKHQRSARADGKAPREPSQQAVRQLENRYGGATFSVPSAIDGPRRLSTPLPAHPPSACRAANQRVRVQLLGQSEQAALDR